MMGGGVELFPYNLSGGRACFEVVICVSDISTLTEILGGLIIIFPNIIM